jgi:hypothetical protein
MSRGAVAELKRPKIRRSRPACCAWTLAFELVSLYLANPLCLVVSGGVRLLASYHATISIQRPYGSYQPSRKATGLVEQPSA